MTRYVVAAVLIILFVVDAREKELRCMDCRSAKTGFCKGKSLRCPAGSIGCIKTLELSVIGNKTHMSFSRGCNNDPHKCDKQFSFNSGDKHKQIRMISECCDWSNNCNKCKIRVPPYNKTLNKLICPVCYLHGDYNCEHKSYMYCKGYETECMDIAATIHRQEYPEFIFSAMGCTTEHGCSLAPKMAPTSIIKSALKFSCSPAKPITH
ncbi:uncharacterized protein LOC142210211 [Leptodactylus fuscus]|uniref:uncharacterized protein LOC142210211 n=1 Tax=Leptodactylus fuscus TaxID=238119 RepID=UPI003F4EC365